MPSVAGATVKQAKATVTIVNNTITQDQLIQFEVQLSKLQELAEEMKPFAKFVEEFEKQALTLATGLKENEWKAKNREEIAQLMLERLNSGKFKVEPGLFDFAITEPTPAKRSPKYKDLLEAKVGSAELLKIQNETPESHSYHIAPVTK